MSNANKFNLEECLMALAEEREIFHSEADFQFALAWKIQELYSKANIRLEYPIEAPEKMAIDIVVFLGGKFIPIELKYKTAELGPENREYETAELDITEDEKFLLKNQSADPIGRYELLKDIERIENIEKKGFSEGYTIWLTNHARYWKGPTKKDTICAQFTVHDNSGINGPTSLDWAERTSEKIKKSPIQIKNRYQFSWKDYSPPSTDKNGQFKYCLTKIEKTS